MKVCLVIPPSVFLIDERVFMSLGILRVAAVLLQAGVEVEVLDLSGVKYWQELIHTQKVDVFGITSTTPQLPAAVNILNEIKKYKLGKVILGGPHVTLVNAAKTKRAQEALKQLQGFDVLVAGDGEHAIFQALEG